MTVRKFLGACAVVTVACAAAVPASALPTLNSGSFTFSAATTTVSNLATTNGFFILNPTSLATSSPTGDFVSNPPPAALALPNVILFGGILDITFKDDFNFSDSSFGAFTAASVSSLHTTTNGAQVSVGFDVAGTFVPGTGWANAGLNFSATESWLLEQTGGLNNPISMNGTFQAPANVPPAPVPEPATLLVLGFGLFAAGAFGNRKPKVGSA